MTLMVEGAKLDVAALRADSGVTDLTIHTIHRNDIGRLEGLEALPLERLELRWLSAPDLSCVGFPKSLKALSVWQSGKLRSLKGLENAPELQSLYLEDNGPLEDIQPVSHLLKLRELSIIGGFNAQQQIGSIAGIEDLPIETLSMRAIAGAKLDLSPVARLSQVKVLDLHGPNFAPEELAKVAAAHPFFLEQLLDLPDYPLGGMNCKKCGGTQKQMFLRRKKFLWCPSCNQKGIDKALNEFRELVEKARH